jgi:hypothetical protein
MQMSLRAAFHRPDPCTARKGRCVLRDGEANSGWQGDCFPGLSGHLCLRYTVLRPVQGWSRQCKHNPPAAAAEELAGQKRIQVDLIE